jgi:membrane associated rhomboid family serine protease
MRLSLKAPTPPSNDDLFAKLEAEISQTPVSGKTTNSKRGSLIRWLSPYLPLLALIGANIVIFALQGLTAGRLTRDGALLESYLDNGEWWRLITNGFLHADWVHLAGNMVGLLILGVWLIRRIGLERVTFVFFFGLLMAGWGSVLFQSNISVVGASGAVFAFAGCLLTISLKQRTFIGAILVSAWIIWSLLMTFIGEGIAWGAHLGGLLGGLLIGWMLIQEGILRSDFQSRLIGIGGLCLAALLALQLG